MYRTKLLDITLIVVRHIDSNIQMSEIDINEYVDLFQEDKSQKSFPNCMQPSIPDEDGQNPFLHDSGYFNSDGINVSNDITLL